MVLELRNLAVGSSPTICSAANMEVEVVSLHFPKESYKHGRCVLYPLLLSFQKETLLILFFLSTELLR